MSSAFNIPARKVAPNSPAPRGWTAVFADGEAKGWNDCLDAIHAANPVDAVPGEPVAKLQAIGWAAFDARENRMRTRCETREQIDAYIHQQHQSRDDITLYARPIFAGERS